MIGRHLLTWAALAALILGAGCSDRDLTGLPIARAPVDSLVFTDGENFGADVYFQAFAGTDAYALSPDSLYAVGDRTSLKVVVPPQDSALGAYAGGVLTATAVRDLVDFNALTFYAKASVSCTLNVAGFGNDNTGTSLHEASRAGVPLTTDWTLVVVPVPSPAKLIAERGLFTFAEGWESLRPQGHEIWFDEIRFAARDDIANPRPFMPSSGKQYFIGSTVRLQGTRTTFDVNGADVVVDHLPGYFDFLSTNPAVAAVTRRGIEIVGVGDATVTAKLDTVAVQGSVTLSGYRPPVAAAQVPAIPAERVISLYSDAYADVPVDSWNTHWRWSTAEDEEYAVAGDNTRMYANLNFVGIEFMTQKIDASAMTHFHMDVYAPAGTNFKIKFVDFPPSLSYGVQTQDLVLDERTAPAFGAGVWSSLEIPLEAFTFQPPSPAPWENIGQLVLSTSDAVLVLVDNVYWHN